MTPADVRALRVPEYEAFRKVFDEYRKAQEKAAREQARRR